MNRLLGHFVSTETAVLVVCELALSFLVIYVMLGMLGGAPLIVSADGMGTQPAAPVSANLAAVLALTIAGTAAAIGLYRPEICGERRRLLVNAALAGILALPALLIVSRGFHVGMSPRRVILFAKVLLVWLGCVVAMRTLFNQIMRERWFVRRILLLGSPGHIGLLQKLAKAGRGRLFEPVVLPRDAYAGAATPLTRAALQRQHIWAIVVARRADGISELPLETLLDCKLRGIPVFDDASFSEQHLGRIDIDSLGTDRLLFSDGFANGWISNTAKRGFDIVVSLSLLLLTSPLMLLIALLIKWDSAGPVLYRQQRTGLHGQPFTLLKFRSMTIDAEKAGKPRWTSQQDPRITHIGGVIRPARIDELPQLLNVLRGEMSMVGPRPERPHFVEQLSRIIPLYSERSYVKPGLTGWAQVNYPYGASVNDARQKLAYDLYYLKNRSLLLDTLILLATIRVILFREGAR
jgi:sugar transferase (PEP-CTERM system associated)